MDSESQPKREGRQGAELGLNAKSSYGGVDTAGLCPLCVCVCVCVCVSVCTAPHLHGVVVVIDGRQLDVLHLDVAGLQGGALYGRAPTVTGRHGDELGASQHLGDGTGVERQNSQSRVRSPSWSQLFAALYRGVWSITISPKRLNSHQNTEINSTRIRRKTCLFNIGVNWGVFYMTCQLGLAILVPLY